jgi:hypothetical protein
VSLENRVHDVLASGVPILGQPLGGVHGEVLIDNIHVNQLLQNRTLLEFSSFQAKLNLTEVLGDQGEVGRSIGRIEDGRDFTLSLC